MVQECFVKRYTFSVTKENETSMDIPFEFLSKEEMAEDPYHMNEPHDGSRTFQIGVHIC